jgi:hypothetical protein
MAAGISEDRAPDRLPDPDPAYPIILPNGDHFDQATMHKAMQSRLPQVLRAVDEGLKGDPIYEWQTDAEGQKIRQLVGRKPNAKIVELALIHGYGKPSENRANPSTRSLKALFARRDDGSSALYQTVEYDIVDEDYE